MENMNVIFVVFFFLTIFEIYIKYPADNELAVGSV